MNERELALSHFGILGMHWGKRKAPTPTGELKGRHARRAKRAAILEEYTKRSPYGRMEVESHFIKKGKWATDRVLDRMGNQKNMSFRRAKLRKNAFDLAMGTLAVLGAFAVVAS